VPHRSNEDGRRLDSLVGSGDHRKWFGKSARRGFKGGSTHGIAARLGKADRRYEGLRQPFKASRVFDAEGWIKMGEELLQRCLWSTIRWVCVMPLWHREVVARTTVTTAVFVDGQLQWVSKPDRVDSGIEVSVDRRGYRSQT